MIKLFNTLSKKVEVFKPIDDVVKIYCCGVTVYDLCHLGHARSYIAWDVLRRFLIYSDFKVKYVQNFTDIDDKILKRAKEESSSMKEVSEKNIIEEHSKETNSKLSNEIIKNFDKETLNFVQVCPKEMLDKLKHPITTKSTIKKVS